MCQDDDRPAYEEPMSYEDERALDALTAAMKDNVYARVYAATMYTLRMALGGVVLDLTRVLKDSGCEEADAVVRDLMLMNHFPHHLVASTQLNISIQMAPGVVQNFYVPHMRPELIRRVDNGGENSHG